MLSFLLSRLLSMGLVIMGVITLVFLLIHLVPGDPVQAMLGEAATPTDQQALRIALGLDQPLLWQWWQYVTGLVQGDLGVSLYSQQPISEMLWQRLPTTFTLAICSLAVALSLALPLGIIAALRHDTAWDYTAMAVSLLGVSIPNFVMGPLLIIIFALQLGWLPISGDEHWSGYVLPAITLGTALAAILARMIRSTLLEVLHEDYIRTARGKGLHEVGVVIHHALRNAALPIITLIGLQLGTLLVGAVITETIFALPGLGQLTVDAIKQRDYPVVQACVLCISLTYVLVNTLTDALYAGLDPRVRYRV